MYIGAAVVPLFVGNHEKIDIKTRVYYSITLLALNQFQNAILFLQLVSCNLTMIF